MTGQDALRLAQAHMEAQGWPCEPPVRVRLHRPWFFGRPCWEVWTNAGSLGRNARVQLDDETGAVVSSGFALR